MNRISILAALVALAAPLHAFAGPGGEQGQVRKELRAGNILKSSQIEARIIPQLPGWQYIGFEFDQVALAYRLKFIREGRVIFVDVDARSGDILRQTR